MRGAANRTPGRTVKDSTAAELMLGYFTRSENMHLSILKGDSR